MGEEKIIKRRRTRKRDAATWALIRDGYEKGYSVDYLATHYGPSVSWIYVKIKREAWARRPDGAEPLAELAPVRVAVAAVESPADLNASALEVLGLAVAAAKRGDHGPARSFAQVAETFRRVAERMEAGAAGQLRGDYAGSEATFTPARDLEALLSARLGLDVGVKR